MKKGVLVCLLCVSVLAQAQVPVSSKIRLSLGKVWDHPSLGLSMQRVLALQMRQYRLLPFPSVPLQVLQHNLRNFSPERQQMILQDYHRVLQQTADLAKSLDTKIYYQGGFESRQLLPQEIADDQRAILKALRDVKATQVFFEKPDEALTQAALYLTRVSRFYQDYGTGTLEPLDEQILSVSDWARETFQRERFFLKDPVPAVEALPLPQKLRVAIVTDYGVREDFQRMAKKENLSLWEFDVYRNPEEFLNSPEHLTYDLVLTDVIISHGGGKYLARQLRHDNFKGGIVAVTAFPEQDLIGMELKSSGMDGMIMLSDIDPYLVLERPAMFARKLRNYFYYKDHPLRATPDPMTSPLP